jgi:hypothetical protein
MKSSKLLKTNFLFLLFTLFSSEAISQTKELGLQSISIQGNEYQNSCTPAQKSILKDSLYKENIPNKSEAWYLLDLLLCAPSTNKNVTKVVKSAKSMIKVETEATGEQGPDSSTVNVNSQFVESLLAQGQAWRASIVVLDNTIKLHYFPNEACVEERVLEFSMRKWKLIETGQACD